jgi:sarcosine oxidase subunit beta
MKKSAEIVIIGGGVNGVACAYYLAKRGMKDIMLIEKRYLGAGATGRCGGGVRQQWGMDENIILARDSVKLMERLTAELNFNIFFRQGGYIILISDEGEYDLISRTIPRQNALGVPTELLTTEQIAAMIPGLNLKSVIAGAYCPSDGTAYPYAVLWGYAEAAKRRGVEIHLHTNVDEVSRSNDTLYEVKTSRGMIHTPRILNVAGSATKHIASMLGVDIPTQQYRHEIAVTEPVKPFFDPMVISLRAGFYFSQTMRGEIVGGIGNPHESPSTSTASTTEFLFRYASALRETFPSLARLRIIRQWAGLYDMSPDARPIIGSVDGLEGYYHACGFSGHGFMLSPIVATLLSELITSGSSSVPIEGLSLKRFEQSSLKKDPYVVG